MKGKICQECGHRVDGPDAAFKDWEYARKAVELKLSETQEELAQLKCKQQIVQNNS